MYEINQTVFFRQATQAHLRLLQESEQLRLIESARPYTPNTWDKVALILGNWLIKLGSKLKARSIYTKLSEKHA
jgi:hypothetical protein